MKNKADVEILLISEEQYELMIKRYGVIVGIPMYVTPSGKMYPEPAEGEAK